MLVKKLLVPGVLLAAGQYLVAIGLEGTAANSKTQVQNSATGDSRSELIGKSVESAEPVELVEPVDNQAVRLSPSEAEVPAIQDPLLSSLITPLPPLLLPDLLMPPYDYPSFNSQRLDEELQIYSRYLRIYGTPDVLIVGSSRSLQGIDPIALQEGLEAQGYAGIKVFNFGINGATAQVIELLLLRILAEEQLPRMIIWGDGLRAFNDGRTDLTYNEILRSEGYRRLEQGTHPIPARTFYREPAVLSASANQVLVNSALTESIQQSISSVLDMYGFQSITGRFDPTTYYQSYPKVPGSFDSDYVPFSLGAEQTASTIAIADFAKAKNIPLVVVNLPLTQDYLDTQRQTYERQFLQHMQQLSQERKFLFVNLNQHPELRQNQYFADPSHINHEGARAMAYHLAANSTIPWHILRSNHPDNEAIVQDPANSSLEN